MDYWITTHWPIPQWDKDFARHVWVKDRHVSYPGPGDIVLVRESLSVKGKRNVTAVRSHHGQRRTVTIPAGYGGIIGSMEVVGTGPRAARPDDVVYDFGDLPEWKVIDCRGFRPMQLPLDRLLVEIGADSTMFLSLWKIPAPIVAPLLDALGRDSGSES